MANGSREPSVRVFDVLHGEAVTHRSTPFGEMGRVFTGSGIECVWVRMYYEQVDADWFSSDDVDLMIVVQGELRFEFDSPDDPLRCSALARFSSCRRIPAVAPTRGRETEAKPRYSSPSIRPTNPPTSASGNSSRQA